jgi:hypothetical protein
MINPIIQPYAPDLQAAEAATSRAAQLQDQQEEQQTLHREAFVDAFGQTLFGQMLSAMRKTLEKPAYLHGGRAEEVFQAQLDQVIAEKISDATAESLAGPMFDLLMMRRP